MNTFIFVPPLPRISGGMVVLARLGKVLHHAGHDVFFVIKEPFPWLSDFSVPLCDWENLNLTEQDICLVPEGWPGLLVPALKAKARTVVYIQNWAYLFAELPPALRLEALPLEFLAVSRPVAWHLTYELGRDSQLLTPGLDIGDGKVFYPPAAEQAFKFGQRPRIAYMPRKNKVLARQIQENLQARRKRLGQSLPEWVEISHMSQAQVAETLRTCQIFLSTGFPEGFALPPLEAMACGCVGVGFSGFGGWEYMRSPRLPLPEGGDILPGQVGSWLPQSLQDLLVQPKGGPPANGFWTADGDVMAALVALEEALHVLENKPQVWQALRQGALHTAANYSAQNFENKVLEIWKKWLG